MVMDNPISLACATGFCSTCSDEEDCSCECHMPEPECACVRIDVDLDDASDCPLHGPNSELARRQKQQEAQDIWDFYNRREQ